MPLPLPLPLPLSTAAGSKSSTEFHHPGLWLIKEGFGRSVQPVNTSGRNQLKTSFYSIFALNWQHEAHSYPTYPYLPNLWLIKQEWSSAAAAATDAAAGRGRRIKISYWVTSSKSSVDKRGFCQKCPASQHVRKEPTKNKFLVDFALNQQHDTPSPLTYPYLQNLWLIKEEW